MTSPAPLRIVFVISGYPPVAAAGMETQCQRLATALARDGHQVQVITMASRGFPALATEDGVVVHRVVKPIPFGPLWGVTYSRHVRQALRAHAVGCDAIVCQQLYLHTIVALEEFVRHRAPVLCRLSSSGPGSDIARLRGHRRGEMLVRKALQAHGFLAISRQVESDLKSAGVGRDRIHAFPNGTLIPDLQTLPETRGDEVLFVGRFRTLKNIPLLIDAFEIARTNAGCGTLRIVGGGPEENDLRARVALSPCAKSIAIEPWSANTAALYRNARVVVMASQYEGMSNVLLEAMAHGCAVVTTDVGGARDLLDPDHRAPTTIVSGQPFEGAGGWIVAHDDRDAYASLLRRLLTDDDLARRQGAAAAARIRDSFSMEATADRLVAVVRALRGGPA